MYDVLYCELACCYCVLCGHMSGSCISNVCVASCFLFGLFMLALVFLMWFVFAILEVVIEGWLY